MDFTRAAAHVRSSAAQRAKMRLQSPAQAQAANTQKANGAKVAVPAMFDVLVKGANRIAIGGNNTTSRPARGRLMQVLKMYADHRHMFNEKSFYHLLSVEFRAIPQSAHEPLFRYVSRHQPAFPLTHLLNLLLPAGFTKERSILDFPCTIENVAKKETVEEAAEEIRLEMIQHLRKKRISMRDYFTGIDTDNSGSVDIAELIASLRHDNMGIGRYPATKSLVRRFDTSGHGRLTFADFEQMLALASPKSQLRLERLGLAGVRTSPHGSGSRGSTHRHGHGSGSKHRHHSSSKQRSSVPAAGVSTSPINAGVRTSPIHATTTKQQRQLQHRSPEAAAPAAGAGAGAAGSRSGSRSPGSSSRSPGSSSRSPRASSRSPGASSRSPGASSRSSRSPGSSSRSPGSSSRSPGGVRRSPSFAGARLRVGGGSSGLRKSPSFAGGRRSPGGGGGVGGGNLPSPFSKNFELHKKAWGGV